MNEEEIKARLAAVVEALLDKGLPEPRASLEIFPHERVRGWAAFKGSNGSVFLYGGTTLEALDKLTDWAQTRPSVAEQKIKDAAALSAKAVEALKEAGAEGVDTDALIALFEAQMKALSDNILEDKSDE